MYSSSSKATLAYNNLNYSINKVKENTYYCVWILSDGSIFLYKSPSFCWICPTIHYTMNRVAGVAVIFFYHFGHSQSEEFKVARSLERYFILIWAVLESNQFGGFWSRPWTKTCSASGSMKVIFLKYWSWHITGAN